MAVATFDTLKFADTLKAAGVPPAHAEAEARALSEVIQLNLKELVTKDDLESAKKELKQEIKDAEQRVNAKVDLLAADLKATRAELKGDIQLLRWMAGVGLTMGVGILVRLFLIRGPIG